MLWGGSLPAPLHLFTLSAFVQVQSRRVALLTLAGIDSIFSARLPQQGIWKSFNRKCSLEVHVKVSKLEQYKAELAGKDNQTGAFKSNGEAMGIRQVRAKTMGLLLQPVTVYAELVALERHRKCRKCVSLFYYFLG